MVCTLQVTLAMFRSYSSKILLSLLICIVIFFRLKSRHFLAENKMFLTGQVEGARGKTVAPAKYNLNLSFVTTGTLACGLCIKNSDLPWSDIFFLQVLNLPNELCFTETKELIKV